LTTIPCQEKGEPSDPLGEGNALDQRQAPDELLGVESKCIVVVVSGGNGEADDFGAALVMGPDHVDLLDEDPADRRAVDLVKPL